MPFADHPLYFPADLDSLVKSSSACALLSFSLLFSTLLSSPIGDVMADMPSLGLLPLPGLLSVNPLEFLCLLGFVAAPLFFFQELETCCTIAVVIDIHQYAKSLKRDITELGQLFLGGLFVELVFRHTRRQETFTYR